MELQPVIDYLDKHPWLTKLVMFCLFLMALAATTNAGILTTADARALLGTITGILGLACTAALVGRF